VTGRELRLPVSTEEVRSRQGAAPVAERIVAYLRSLDGEEGPMCLQD